MPASHPTGADEGGPPGRPFSTAAARRPSVHTPEQATSAPAQAPATEGGRLRPRLGPAAGADTPAAPEGPPAHPSLGSPPNRAIDRSDEGDPSFADGRAGTSGPSTTPGAAPADAPPAPPTGASGNLARSIAALVEPPVEHDGGSVHGTRDGVLEAEIDDPELGRLHVRIERDDGEVRVRIVVDDPVLRRLADARIADLRTTLRQSAGTEVMVDVATDGDRRNRDASADGSTPRRAVAARPPAEATPRPANRQPPAVGDPRRMVDAVA